MEVLDFKTQSTKYTASHCKAHTLSNVECRFPSLLEILPTQNEKISNFFFLAFDVKPLDNPADYS